MPRSSRLSDKYAPILKEAKKATILNGIISVAARQAEGHGASDQAKNKFASVLKFLRVLSLLIDRGEIISGFGGDSGLSSKWSSATGWELCPWVSSPIHESMFGHGISLAEQSSRTSSMPPSETGHAFGPTPAASNRIQRELPTSSKQHWLPSPRPEEQRTAHAAHSQPRQLHLLGLCPPVEPTIGQRAQNRNRRLHPRSGFAYWHSDKSRSPPLSRNCSSKR